MESSLDCDRCCRVVFRNGHLVELPGPYIQYWCHRCFMEEPVKEFNPEEWEIREEK